jgi:hypothetical protein
MDAISPPRLSVRACAARDGQLQKGPSPLPIWRSKAQSHQRWIVLYPFASDLHLEFLQESWPGERIIDPVADVDVLVLAGDIAAGSNGIRSFGDWPSPDARVPIIYIAGNHEFYGHPLEPQRERMKAAAAQRDVHFLENETIVIGQVRFLGATLWTDYKLRPDRTQAQQMEAVERGLNDHRLIRTGRKLFTANDALERHMESRAWLISELVKPWEGKTVVVTHHGPHPLSTHPRYVDNPLNGGFVSDLSEILLSGAAPDFWLHGHVHDGFDYTVGRTRVVANPAGYVRNRRSARSRQAFEFENPIFNPTMVLEV